MEKIVIGSHFHGYFGLVVLAMGCGPILFPMFFVNIDYFSSKLLWIVEFLLMFWMFYSYWLDIITIEMSARGCLVRKGFKSKFHTWKDIKVIRHDKYTSFMMELSLPIGDEEIFFSVNEKTKKAGKTSKVYLMFKNKLDTFFVYTPRKYIDSGLRKKLNVYDRDKLLQQLGAWGVKVESKYIDTSIYYKEVGELEDEDGVYARKKSKNHWLISNEKGKYNVVFNFENEKPQILLDDKEIEIQEESIIKMIGIDQVLELDGHQYHFVLEKGEGRIVEMGKYQDTNDFYLPLKSRRNIYACLLIALFVGVLGFVLKMDELYLITFFMVGGAGFYALCHDGKN